MSAQKAHLVDLDAVKTFSLSEFLRRELNCESKQFGKSLRFSHCPFCGPSSRNSVKLSVSEDDCTYHCFACGQGGSILDAAMHLYSCSLSEAAERILGVRHQLSAVARPAAEVSAASKDQADLKTARMRLAFSRIQKLCLSEFRDSPEPLHYLVHQRKIPLELVREAQARGMLGFLPGDVNLAREALTSAVGEDLLREVGLWKPDSVLPGIAYRPLVFFLPNLSSAEFRHIAEVRQEWSKSIRYGKLEYPYFWEGTNAQCMIVEGLIDLLSAVALGFQGHVLGLTGCNSFREEWFVAAAKRYGLKRYVVALDNDVAQKSNPGQMWAQKINALITSLGIPSVVHSPAQGDINDILRSRPQPFS